MTSFDPYSPEALVATVLGWIGGLAIMYLIALLIWPWEGGGRMRKRSSGRGRIGLINRDIPIEKLMLIGWLYFWVVVLVGIALTRFTRLDYETTLLTQVFGYNNICVNFDFAPSSYTLPFLWAITCIVLWCFQLLKLMVMNWDVAQGKLSARSNAILRGLVLFSMLTYVFFSTIFAVTPEPENVDPDHITVMIHTFPFTMLQFGMLSHMIVVTAHYSIIGHWAVLGLNHNVCKWCGITYCVMYSAIIIFKTIVSWNAMFKHGWFDGRAVNESGMSEAADKGFMACAAVLPVVMCMYLLAFKYDKLVKIQIRVSNDSLQINVSSDISQ